jgi:hypothetical protein
MFDAEAQARASRAALKVIGFAGVSNASPLLLSCSRMSVFFCRTCR